MDTETKQSRRNAVLTAMAATIWTNAYDSWLNSTGEALDAAEDADGDLVCDLEEDEIKAYEDADGEPDVPESALTVAATELLARYARSNGLTEGALIDRIYDTASRDKEDYDGSVLDALCHYLVMEALGTGVSFDESYWPHDLQMPAHFDVIAFYAQGRWWVELA